jgi:hypothetical protein
MKMLHSSYSTTIAQAEPVNPDMLSLNEAMRIYFTILFGVATVMLTYYYLLPNMH